MSGASSWLVNRSPMPEGGRWGECGDVTSTARSVAVNEAQMDAATREYFEELKGLLGL